MLVTTNPGASFSAARPQAAATPPAASTPTETYQSSGTVGRITGKEALSVGAAALGGAVLAGLGGATVSWLGPLAGIPVAIAGEAVLGGGIMYAIVRDAHDGSVIGGNTLVGGAAGAIAGALGSIGGAIVGGLTGGATGAILGGAAFGALAAGGFATWLALNN